MEWWNGHFNHFLMDGGKGSFRGQHIRMLAVLNLWNGIQLNEQQFQGVGGGRRANTYYDVSFTEDFRGMGENQLPPPTSQPAQALPAI